MANSVDPDQTGPIGAVCSGSTLFASILSSSVMLGNYFQQMTSTDSIFRCILFHGALRVSILFPPNIANDRMAAIKQTDMKTNREAAI